MHSFMSMGLFYCQQNHGEIAEHFVFREKLIKNFIGLHLALEIANACLVIDSMDVIFIFADINLIGANDIWMYYCL